MDRQFIANVANTIRLVASNLYDDPSYFALQVARKFKTAPGMTALRSTLGAKQSPALLKALGAMISDDDDRLRDVSQSWVENERHGFGTVFLANMCTASGQWDLANQLLLLADQSRRKVRAQARLAWSLGKMSQAIKILSELGPSRQRRHYESEFAVYSGAEPTIKQSAACRYSVENPQSVLFLATNSLPHTGSGYAQRTHSVLSAVHELGWDVVAATRVQYPLNIGKLKAPVKDLVGTITYERLLPRSARHEMLGKVQQQADELLKNVLRERPAVLHTTTDFSNALAVQAVAKAVGIPWVYEVRGQLADTWLSTRPATSATSEKYRLFMQRESAVAQAADHVLTLGQEMKDNLVKAGVEANKITIVPNAVGEKFLEPPVDRNAARQELELDQEAFYVGTVSSLVPYEGLSVVVEAVALLASEFTNLRLLIVGDGTDRENLVKLAQKLGISDRCEFPGRVPRDQANLYHSALNVFVVPRIDSSVTRSVTPLKPVEAMASNVPVLASDLPALHELVKDGENGHLVTAGDVQAWATAIRERILDPGGTERMGKSGREFVLDNRTWAKNAKTIVEVYDRVISQVQ